MTGSGEPKGAVPAVGARFARAFEAASDRAALAAFVVAGHPQIDSTPAVLDAVAGGGADLIELGIPFSDPVADGPSIQRASEAALANGINLSLVLRMGGEFRSRWPDFPLVLMGYSNSLVNYGLERFAAEAGERGVDGVIVVDLPVEQSAEWRRILGRNGVAMTLLAAPTTTPERMRLIAERSEGFVYFVSLKGVTGSDRFDADYAGRFVEGIKRHARLPVMVGFGIRTPEQAQAAAAVADGVVVGSGLIEIADGCPAANLPARVGEYIGRMAQACGRR